MLLPGGGLAHLADGLTRLHLVAGGDGELVRQISVDSVQAVRGLDGDGFPQQHIVLDRDHRAVHGGGHRVSHLGGDVNAGVGAPVPHGLVVGELLRGEGRGHLTLQGPGPLGSGAGGHGGTVLGLVGGGLRLLLLCRSGLLRRLRLQILIALRLARGRLLGFRGLLRCVGRSLTAGGIPGLVLGLAVLRVRGNCYVVLLGPGQPAPPPGRKPTGWAARPSGRPSGTGNSLSRRWPPHTGRGRCRTPYPPESRRFYSRLSAFSKATPPCRYCGRNFHWIYLG